MVFRRPGIGRGHLQGSHGAEMLPWYEERLDQRSQAGEGQKWVESQTRSQPLGRLQLQQVAHVLGREDRLDAQQQSISPRPKVATVRRVQRVGAIAAYQVATQVTLTIGSPLSVAWRQVGDLQASAYSVEDVIELAPLVRGEGTREHLVRSFGVVDEHVQHVAVGPIGDGLAATTLNRLMDCS